MRTGIRGGFSGGASSIGRILALACVAVLLAACGGGGGGSPSSGGGTPPSSVALTYPSGVQTFTVGTAITPITPTVTGTLTSFTVSPALPAGLSLDSGKGTLSGTPTAVAASANYTVSATGTGGSASATVTIVVNDAPPSNVSYGSAAFTFSATVASSTLTPTVGGGAVVSWSINPALPAGLSFSTTDGAISGTPTAPSASASYVITAHNSGGQSTVTLVLEVDGAPFINLGHQGRVASVRATATNVLSVDSLGYWILWNYSTAAIVATGNSGCQSGGGACSALGPMVDMAGSTAAVLTPSGFELLSSTDGHVLGSITTLSPVGGNVVWWKLATDGSYLVVGSQTALSAYSPSGQLLFSNAGNYGNTVGFAAPGKILVGGGPAGQNVVETIAVPAGTSTTGPQFNGQFSSWFVDGSAFLTSAGGTILVYSAAGTQQGTIAPGALAYGSLVGQGNWVWTYPPNNAGGTYTLNIYPATGTSTAPSAQYNFSIFSQANAAGNLIVAWDSSGLTTIDLSGSTPAKTTYPGSFPLGALGQGAAVVAPVSASEWVIGGTTGVLLDGASLAGTTRYLGYGLTRGIAGGTGYFAISTSTGVILYFDSQTLAQAGQINFSADKLTISSDGTLLVAQGTSDAIQVYSLPTGTLQYTWPAPANLYFPPDIELAASGSMLGQLPQAGENLLAQVTAPTGGSTSLVVSVNGGRGSILRLSPDGTLVALAASGIYQDVVTALPATNLYQNGNLVTAFNGFPSGWLDNSRLVVNNYSSTTSEGYTAYKYSGCTLYGSNGSSTGGACALASQITQFQPVTSDLIYSPELNQVVSVSTGAIAWTSANPNDLLGNPIVGGAVAGSQAIFLTGIGLVSQSY